MLIEIDQLRKRYRGSERPALDGIGLRVPAGCIYGLLGPNGAGKTTLMSILTGTLAADSGTVRVAGIDATHDGSSARQLIGYAPQELAFYPGLTVAENLQLFAALTPGADAAKLERAIAAADLSRQLNKPAEALSGGLRRRLNFAIALLGEPRLLCLDEATAGVDPQSRNFLLQAVLALRGRGVTVLYSTHYMEEIEKICDRVAIIDHGQLIAEGELSELRSHPDERLETVFLRLTRAELRDGP